MGQTAERYGVDVTVPGALTPPVSVVDATIARMQVAAPTLATAVIELLGSLDGDTWVVMDPAVELSAAGVTAPVTIVGFRYLRARVQVVEASSVTVNVTIWSENYPFVLDTTANVVGPGSSTDNAIPRFDGTTGKTIQNSGVTIDDSDNIATTGTVDGRDVSADGAELDAIFPLVDGACINTPAVTVASDGATITLSVEQSGGGDLTVLFSTGIYTWDTTPADTVSLTAGTDTVPVLSYIYFLESTKTLTASTVGWPAAEHAPIASVLCQSAASVQTDGVYKMHAWTDHISSSGGNGHLAHLNKWIRSQHATYISGVAPTFSGTGTGTIGLATTSGVAQQLHEHAFPAFSDPATVYCVNDPDTAYREVTNIADLLKDSTGASLTNKTYGLVFWGCVSEDASDCKIYCNLPSGAFNLNQQDRVRQDANKYQDFSIPADFKGTGFLIYRLVIENNGGTTWDLDTGGTGDDLRGQLPNTAAGSTAATGTEFADSTFRVQDDGDLTKEIAFQASGITTATTRTITVPDVDVTLATPTELTKLAGIETAADVTDATNVNAAGAVMESDYVTTNSILYAQVAQTPQSLQIAASRIVGRTALGNVDGLTAAEVRTILAMNDPMWSIGTWWYGAPQGWMRTHSSTYAYTMTGNRMYLQRFRIPEAVTVSDCAIEIDTGQVGANGIIVVFADVAGAVGSLLYESGELDFSSAGAKSEGSLSWALTPPYGWIGVLNETSGVIVDGLNYLTQRTAWFGATFGASSYATAYEVVTYTDGPPASATLAGGANTSEGLAIALKRSA